METVILENSLMVLKEAKHPTQESNGHLRFCGSCFQTH